jgi:hypothetical protein
MPNPATRVCDANDLRRIGAGERDLRGRSADRARVRISGDPAAAAWLLLVCGAAR